MSGWGNGQQGWNQQGQHGQQGWGQHGQQGQQGQWGQQGQQGWGQQGQQGQQGWGQQGQQGQWGQQGQQGQWGQQGQQGQWGQQGQQGQWGQQGQQNQGWSNHQVGFHPVEGKNYKIWSAVAPGLLLDVSQNPNDFNQLIIWNDNGQANQRFQFKNAGNGRWGIFCAKNGMTVEVKDGNNGARLICSQPNKTDNEFWQIIPVTDPKFSHVKAVQFKSFSGRNMDVYQAKG